MARLKPAPEPKPVFPQYKIESPHEIDTNDSDEVGWWNTIRTSYHNAIQKIGEKWRHQDMPEVFYQRAGTIKTTGSNLAPEGKPSFPQFVLVKPEEKPHWWNLDSIRHSVHESIRKIKEKWNYKEVEEIHDQLWSLPSSIPKCHLHCIFEQAMRRGCTYSDLFCICYQIDQDMLAFETCTIECRDNQIERFAPGAILDFCDSQNVALDLPGFMKPYQHLNRRQSQSFDFGPTAPPTIYTVTSTTSLPYGDVLYTYYTSGGFDALTITEVIGVPDTEILTTDITTTTLPAGAKPFTSTFTNTETPVETVVVGLPAITSGPTNSQTKTQPTSSKATRSLTTAPAPGGLSSGAKIGIGVTVPVVFLVLLGLGLFFFLRRRKGKRANPPQPHEVDDGGLPENIASISEIPKHPSYIGPSGVPASGDEWDAMKNNAYGNPELSQIPVHELNAKGDSYHLNAAEISGNPRHEIEGPVDPRHELTSSPSLASSSVVRKPISPAPAYATHAVPAPWEDHGYDPYQSALNSAPALTEEELEIQRMEEEMAQVKLRKERLQNLQMLEEREEELKKSIAERKRKG